MSQSDYDQFLQRKSQIGDNSGFKPLFIPDAMFPFQKAATSWAIEKGRAALLEAPGLGKSIQELTWAQNVVEHTNKPVILPTPIAVGPQMIREADKFGLKAVISRDGKIKGDIVITNYERLGYFNPNDFGGFAGDEISCVKDSSSVTKSTVQEFTRRIPYRLGATATPAPNDYHELGNISEILGGLGYRDMLTMFFKMEQAGGHHAWARSKWRFREHAKNHFWRWICSWARACRKPSDLGDFDDSPFVLPPLHVTQDVIERRVRQKGLLFDMPAVTLEEQRKERRETIVERCERVAELLSDDDFGIAWCHLNPEGDMLEKMIKGCVQVSGRDSEEQKERKLLGFCDGTYHKLVTKPKLAGWGLNMQHCNRMTIFPSHSFESIYQLIRRCWRFGQFRDVFATFVSTEGEERIIENYNRKVVQAEGMFDRLVHFMNDSIRIGSEESFPQQELVPSWI